MDRRLTLVRWVGVATWIAVGGTSWWALSGALDGRSGRAAWAVGLVAGAAWAAVLVALLVPSTTTLTLSRMVAPLALAPAAGAWVAGGESTACAVAVLASCAHLGVVSAAEFGIAQVQGSAYGDEQRFVLKLPPRFAPAMALTWLVWAAIAVLGVLAVAAAAWPLAMLGAAAVVLATLFVAPRFHRFARRWLVVLGTGIVVHDHVVVAESVLGTRANLAGVSLALDDTEAFDLTGPAGGHAIEIALRDMVTVLFPPTREHPSGRAVHAQAVLVAPSRVGAALGAAAVKRLPVR